MNCLACGCEQIGGANFCRQCGAPVAQEPGRPGYPFVPPGFPSYGAAVQAAEQRVRVRQNLQPMGILWIIFGVYRIAAGLVGALVLHHMSRGGLFSEVPPFLPYFLGSIVPVIVVMASVLGLAAIFTGYGLLARQPWARTVAIVFGVIALLKLPFGTALGIYTLWVLAPRASWAEWETISAENSGI